MSISVSITKNFEGTGPIKFSDLRQTFIAQKVKDDYDDNVSYNTKISNTVSASQLLRNENLEVEFPNVPDCNTNRTCGVLNAGISISNNLKLSQFRGSAKYVYVKQTGTNLNLNLSKLDSVTNVPIDSSTSNLWEDNLYDSNIRKVVYIEGTCGSNSSLFPALSLSPEYFIVGENNANSTPTIASGTKRIDNIVLKVNSSGKIHGAGGVYNINSGKGGNALSMNGVGGNHNVIQTDTYSQVWAGGASGKNGNVGSTGNSSCNYNASNNDSSGGGCVSNPGRSCPAGFTGNPVYNPCGKSSCSANPCRSWNLACNYAGTNNISASGGSAGNGGPGKGYQYGGTGQGSAGGPGANVGCPSNDSYGSYNSGNAAVGNPGNPGKYGADWGQPTALGDTPANFNYAGLCGEAISGNYYRLKDADGNPSSHVDYASFQGRYINR